MDIAIWFGLTVAFCALEAATVTLVSIWFAGGALAATIAALLGASWPLELVLFVGVSALLLACLRPLVRKYVTPKVTATNAQALVGQMVLVTESIDNLAAQGAVKVNGVVWTARSASGANIPAGTKVQIDRIEGVKLFVTPAEVAART